MQKYVNKYKFIIAVLTFGLLSFTLFQPIERLSFNLTVKSLQAGKSITATGEVYYQTAGGLMVTHFVTPSELVSITNAFGEYKNYDVKSNSVMQVQGEDYSSKNSFFYFYLTGKTQDMGLTKFGYKLSNTRIEEKTVISTWLPPAEMASKVGRVEIAHENYQPIFIGFYDIKGKAVQKTYYSGFTKVGDLQLPCKITEILYLSAKDSVISKRVYSNLKLNNEVDTKYLTYKIPSNAKVVKQ